MRTTTAALGPRRGLEGAVPEGMASPRLRWAPESSECGAGQGRVSPALPDWAAGGEGEMGPRRPRKMGRA